MKHDQGVVAALREEHSAIGHHHEELHADGTLDAWTELPFGETRYRGEDDPDRNPICDCPGQWPLAFCLECAGCPSASSARATVPTCCVVHAERRLARTWPVREIRDRHEHMKVVGSLNLVQTLLREKLFDRLDLWLHPIVRGVGKKVFDDGAVPTNVTLLAPPAASPKRTVYLRYGLVDGTPATGT
ncbi:dihydrofolate reductase family protein [Streptomyces sp. NPDC056883]|uniref:dihydrofolate reductase family protein n=1 Tax=Streptomyces sp. NPDC056883 TaxID=3345959 RepID=UPI00369682B2